MPAGHIRTHRLQIRDTQVRSEQRRRTELPRSPEPLCPTLCRRAAGMQRGPSFPSFSPAQPLTQTESERHKEKSGGKNKKRKKKRNNTNSPIGTQREARPQPSPRGSTELRRRSPHLQPALGPDSEPAARPPAALTRAAAASPWRLRSAFLRVTRAPRAAASTMPAAAGCRLRPPGGAPLPSGPPGAAGAAHFRGPARRRGGQRRAAVVEPCEQPAGGGFGTCRQLRMMRM